MADFVFKIVNNTSEKGTIVKKNEKAHEPGVAMDQSDWSGSGDPEHQLQGKEIPANGNLIVTLNTKMGISNPWFSFDIEFDNKEGVNGNNRLTITPQLDQDTNGFVKNSDTIHNTKNYARRNRIDSGYLVERQKKETGRGKMDYTLTIKKSH